jgi:ABC-type phosphate transport system ATPase subunit
MNDFVRGFRFYGHACYHGNGIYHPFGDPAPVRRSTGVVSQPPNPFGTSMYDKSDVRLAPEQLQRRARESNWP